MNHMFLWMLIACAAERLGVEVPEGGAASISAEDLQRDVYALSQTGVDAAEVFTKRLGQMHLEARQRGDDHVCALREGPGAPRMVVATWPTTPGEATQVAALISVAKGWDGQPPPKRATWLCMAKPGAALPDAEIVEGVHMDADRPEAIDYRRLRDATKLLLEALNG